VAEEIYLEMYIYGQLSEVEMVRDLDLGSGQGHINIHNTCRSTCSYGQLTEVQMLRDLDLGSGQGHVNIHSTCRTTCMLS